MRKFAFLCLLFLAVALLGGCSSTQYLDVSYQMSMNPNSMEGRTIALAVEDLRPVKTTLGLGAQKKLPYFTEIFAFSLRRPGQAQRLIGPYPIEGLFKEAIKQRLETMGVAVIPEAGPDARKLQININEFSLDLQAGAWVSTISYEAKIVSGDKTLLSDIIRGQAQKSNPAGRWIRPDVLSDNFSDCINKVDLQKLLSATVSSSGQRLAPAEQSFAPLTEPMPEPESGRTLMENVP